MSLINGDKAKAHKHRLNRLKLRERVRELRKQLHKAEPKNKTKPSPDSKA